MDQIERREPLYEGKAKVIYATSDPERYIQYFKDDATAFNGEKKGTIVEKGIFNCAISSHIFALLEKEGIPTHFVAQRSEREMVIKRVEIIPIEVVVRNVAAGSLAKRMGVEEGTRLSGTIVEWYYKDDDLGDPMINEDHIRAFGLATPEEMAVLKAEALRINGWLTRFFDELGMTLVDYKLEFGRGADGIILADEISPDGCRLWDKATGEKMDKDRFRRDLGRIEEVYAEVRDRVLSARGDRK